MPGDGLVVITHLIGGQGDGGLTKFRRAFGRSSGFLAARHRWVPPGRRPWLALAEGPVMAGRRGWPARLVAMALLCGLVAEGRAAPAILEPPFDLPHHLGLWIATSAERLDGPGMAILTHPAGWRSGDAAVVIAPGGDWPDQLRARLVVALLEAGAAVLDLPQGWPWAPGLGSAIHALRRDASAGIIVAIGRGEGGEAALALAGAPQPDVAAMAQIGPGAPLFRFAEAAPAEGWPERAALLCALLADLAPPDAPGLGNACRAALPG
jgi:hypothetical protein